MKKCILAVALASSALIGLPAAAAPLSPAASGLGAQVQADTVQVYHCRSWSAGWDCSHGGDYGGHLRHYSHRRYGSDGGGYRGGYGSGGGYGGGYGSGGGEGYGRYRHWGTRPSEPDNGGDYHSRYMSHQRYDSWKRAF
jgi:hypothetical protein